MRVVLSGGGTGGHIYPAVSIARQCLQENQDTELLYIGSNRGMEKDIIGLEAIPFEPIEITGFKRKLSLDNMKTIVRFIRGAKRCKSLLKQFKPDIVVGTGGYVCGPVIYAAAKLGIPTLIHEQNVIPGLTNRFLSKYADSIAVSFKVSEHHFPKAKKTIYTGNPRATAVVHADPVQGWASLNLAVGSKLVIIVGGSGGAKAINDAVAQMVREMNQLADTHFIYVTGKAYYETAKSTLLSQNVKLPDRLHMVPYLHNMPEVLAAASLIINRAGASFLAEITALGLPSILIPSPNVTNNHQEANARWLAETGAAQLILEKDLTGKTLFAAIHKIMSDPILAETMAKKAKMMGQPDAAQRVLNEMIQISKINLS